VAKKQENMNRFVFLDFDGCLDISTNNLNFDKFLKENIYVLCNIYRAKIVLATSWRFVKTVEEWNKVFNGLVVGITPLYVPADAIGMDCYIPEKTYQRGLEIKQFLEQNDCESYLIIDDCNDFLPEQQSRFVKCDSRKGFDAERLSFAIGCM
jgi:hypothetical protein